MEGMEFHDLSDVCMYLCMIEQMCLLLWKFGLPRDRLNYARRGSKIYEKVHCIFYSMDNNCPIGIDTKFEHFHI